MGALKKGGKGEKSNKSKNSDGDVIGCTGNQRRGEVRGGEGGGCVKCSQRGVESPSLRSPASL